MSNTTRLTKFTTRKEYINPLEVCRIMKITLPDHITINPALKKGNEAKFEMIRQTSHDGTSIFTCDLLEDVLLPILNKNVYYKGDSLEGVTDIKYEIGLISLACVYGHINVPAGHIWGQRQRARMPVKCIYIR